jgi:hypothetical protein
MFGVAGAGATHRFLAARDMWHLQLWHPMAGVSILTPSLLTRYEYEVFPVRGWKARAGDYARLKALVGARQVPLPSESMLLVLEAFYVKDAMAGCLPNTCTGGRDYRSRV